MDKEEIMAGMTETTLWGEGPDDPIEPTTYDLQLENGLEKAKAKARAREDIKIIQD